MGGSNSGWYRGHAPRCEDYAVLDTAKEAPIWWGFWTAKDWYYGEHRGSAWLRVDRTSGYTIREAGVTIDYYGHDDVGRCTHVIATERARIAEQPVGYGGVRRWICCPGCGRRCRVLYGVWRLRCRKCAGLRYRCHMLQKHDRAYQQAEKVARRCDPRARWGQGMPAKPKWMRWPTYERLAKKYEFLEAIGWWAGMPVRLDVLGKIEAHRIRAAYRAWRAEQGGRP